MNNFWLGDRLSWVVLSGGVAISFIICSVGFVLHIVKNSKILKR